MSNGIPTRRRDRGRPRSSFRIVHRGREWQCFVRIRPRPGRRRRLGRVAYRRRGPWPQPAPRYPRHMAPAVLDVPLDQRLLWVRDVGLRYVRDCITYWPKALRWARASRGYRAVSDSEFGTLFEDTVLARTRTTALDRKDLDVVDYLPAPSEPRARAVEGRPSNHAWRGSFPRAPHRRDDHLLRGVRRASRAARDHQIGDDVFDPRDAAAYELAKYFVLQGAAYHILLTSHPLSRFPPDAINAVTTSTLPERHPLAKLLAPHYRYALRQNAAVLYSPRSIVENERAPVHGADGTDRRDPSLNPSGYAGIEDNEAYPSYRFPLEPKDVPGRFGRFLRAYYDPVYELVADVLSTSLRVTRTSRAGPTRSRRIFRASPMRMRSPKATARPCGRLVRVRGLQSFTRPITRASASSRSTPSRSGSGRGRLGAGCRRR